MGAGERQSRTRKLFQGIAIRVMFVCLLCAVALGGAAAQGPTGIQSPNNPQGGSSSSSAITSLPGQSSVSNGVWVTTTDVLWVQYTTQGIGNIVINNSYRILQTNGTVNNGSWVVNPCSLPTNGGFGSGFQVPVNGWLQSFTTYSSTGGFPQGSMFVNLYILNSMPSGAGSTTCSATLAQTNIGTLLNGVPTGSSYPVSFVGTTANPASPWSIPGYTNVLNVTSPAAGADFVSSSLGGTGGGAGGRTCITGVFFKLVTSAAAGNRLVGVDLLFNAGVAQMTYIATVPQGPSTTVFYSFAPGTSAQMQTLASGNTYQTVPFSNGPGICYNANATGTVNSLTNGLQAGDQFSIVNLLTQVQMDND